MSDIAITVETIKSIDIHPDADRLEIVKVLGTQCVVPKDEYHLGQKIIYFPPNMLIPEEEAEKLGVKKYLKHVRWHHGCKYQSLVAACRIRGITSYGFVAPCFQDLPEGYNVTSFYDAEKYEPPESLITGKYVLEEGTFHRYTDIQNYYRYPDMFKDDEEIVISEKCHGSCSRVGVLFENNEWVYAAGSRKNRWMQSRETNRYWKPLQNEPMLNMLAELCGESANVIVFGEIFGPKVQGMNYGVEDDEGYRVLDISVDGRYLNWPNVVKFCQENDVLTVPVIFEGPWICVKHIIDEYACGRTLIGSLKRKFKGREGIVIKPLKERLIGGHRVILKYISADYLNRKGAKDNA